MATAAQPRAKSVDAECIVFLTLLISQRPILYGSSRTATTMSRLRTIPPLPTRSASPSYTHHHLSDPSSETVRPPPYTVTTSPVPPVPLRTQLPNRIISSTHHDSTASPPVRPGGYFTIASLASYTAPLGILEFSAYPTPHPQRGLSQAMAPPHRMPCGRRYRSARRLHCRIALVRGAVQKTSTATTQRLHTPRVTMEPA